MVKSQLIYTRKNDYLQTRVRQPRLVPPNFALYCDWIIWSDQHIHVDFSASPKTVYVRSEIGVLNYFVRNVLGKIKNDFVLITTSHDTPMPMGFQKSFGFGWDVVVNNQYLKAWFTENRDLLHEKIKPIPLGIPHPDLPSWVNGEQSTAFWTEGLFEEIKLYKKKERIFKVFGCWYPRDNHPSGTCQPGDNERQEAYECLIGKQGIFDWYPPGMDRLKFLSAKSELPGYLKDTSLNSKTLDKSRQNGRKHPMNADERGTGIESAEHGMRNRRHGI